MRTKSAESNYAIGAWCACYWHGFLSLFFPVLIDSVDRLLVRHGIWVCFERLLPVAHPNTMMPEHSSRERVMEAVCGTINNSREQKPNRFSRRRVGAHRPPSDKTRFFLSLRMRATPSALHFRRQASKRVAAPQRDRNLPVWSLPCETLASR